jgi:hypothetical protein
VEEVVVIVLVTTRLLEGEVNAAATMMVEVVVVMVATVAERVQAESFMMVRIVWGGTVGEEGTIMTYCMFDLEL